MRSAASQSSSLESMCMESNHIWKIYASALYWGFTGAALGSVSCSRTTPAFCPENSSREACAIVLVGQRHFASLDTTLSVSKFEAHAVVTGPESEFTTTTYSARDGRARVDQSTGFTAGTHPEGDWSVDASSGETGQLEREALAYLRGHELHATFLMPERRMLSAEFVGVTEFEGDSVLAVKYLDPTGSDRFAYYSAADTLPVGMLVTGPDPDVIVTVGRWEQRGPLRLFTSAEFRQGDEVFVYSYRRFSVNDTEDEVFEAP